MLMVGDDGDRKEEKEEDDQVNQNQNRLLKTTSSEVKSVG